MLVREIEKRRGWTKTLIIGAVSAALLLAVFLYILLGGVKPHTTRPDTDNSDPLEAARKKLNEETDIKTCRSALEQINAAYAQTKKQHPPTLDKETRERLEKQFHFGDNNQGELEEIEGETYTPLDAHYLDQCFLLRDAARSLEGNGRGTAGEPLELATRAFAWVVRQVRLREGLFPMVPPQFALRRGWGTALDRALIFLALLEQLGNGEDQPEDTRPPVRGCLLAWPGKTEIPEIWACGVAIETDAWYPHSASKTLGAAVGQHPANFHQVKMYLFDPRLGLPLPGPNGQGVATLAEARNDPEVLKQLTVTSEHHYDVTQERARQANVYQLCALSALAPRMRFLQDEILAPTIRVRLAVDAQADEKILTAAASGVPVAPVPFLHGLLRAFLPKEEGGVDVIQGVKLNQVIRGWGDPKEPNQTDYGVTRQMLFDLELTPWHELPEAFRNPEIFPYTIPLGQRVRAVFAERFIQFAHEPNHARDLMLRGDYVHAIEGLSKENQETINHLRQWKKILSDPEMRVKLGNWVEQAQRAYAAELRAKKDNNAATQNEAAKLIDKVWAAESAGVVLELLNGAVAQTRGPQTVYYLALCKHEMAEQAQVQLGDKAQAAEWDEAVYWWQRFVDDAPEMPEREAARRLQARALWMHGDHTEALTLLKSKVPGDTHELETVACLYLAARWAKK